MKIGFFGGSFDPIHFGHLNLAIELKEKCALDEVWFCPANINPHKNFGPQDSHLRLQMVKLAIEGISCFKVIEDEIKRAGPSYTAHTLRDLTKAFPANEWYLILGEDALLSFSKWKEPDEILALATPLIGSRTGNPIIDSPFRKVSISNFDISSTTVRLRLLKGLYCGHLVPGKVLDFISQNSLYS